MEATRINNHSGRSRSDAAVNFAPVVERVAAGIALSFLLARR